MFVRVAHYLLMAMLILLSFAFGLTGPEWHEVVGLGFIAVAFSHLVLNRWWFRMLIERRSMIQPCAKITNILLLVATLVMLVTGLMQSHLFNLFADQGAGLNLRRHHTIAAYWMFILSAWHIGLHVPVWAALKNRLLLNKPILASIVNGALWPALTVISIYGAFFAFIRDFVHKLFGLSTFDFWDFQAAPFGFFIGYVCVAIFIAVLPALWIKAKTQWLN